jgi:hypothetical protein
LLSVFPTPASYTKLKNLNMLMAVALYFVYSCKDAIKRIAVGFLKTICFRAKDWKKLHKFIYYRISQVSHICLKHTSHYNTSPYRYDKTVPLQKKTGC